MSGPLTPEQSDLLARVLSFDIDGGAAALPFAARLAREQGWSRAYAERVVEEYKRFAFLAATAGTVVCPSEDVDAAWHLHLTYTRSYWQRFCGAVLGRPLHHDPTRGGPAEHARHLKMYADTLTAYQEAFGRTAPSDIWPPSDARFGDDTRHRAVNTARNWVIPKAPVRRAAQLVAVFALLAFVLPGCDQSFNPFALKKADILVPIALAFVAAAIGGRVIRWTLRTPKPTPEDQNRALTWEQTAYLAGGAGRLTTAALARVVGRGLAAVGPDGKTLSAAGAWATDTSPVERAVLGALPVTNDAAALKPVESAVEAAFAAEAERMRAEELTLTEGRKARIWFASMVPLALVVFGLCVPQMIMGKMRKAPIEFLVMLTVFGSFVALILTSAGSLRLSRRGMAVLEAQKSRHQRLKAAADWNGNGDAGLAVALFGTAVLAGTPLMPLQTWYPRQTAEASASGCSVSSGCGSGCGGGGCGGGGD